MAISIVNDTVITVGYGGTASVTIPSTTAGNTLLILCNLDEYNFSDISLIALSGGGTWTTGATTATDTDGGSAVLWYAYIGSCSGGTTSVTFDAGTNRWNALVGHIYELSGTDISAPILTAAAASTSSTPPNSVTASPSSAGAAFAEGMSHSSTGTWSAGYTDNGHGATFWYCNNAYNLSTPSGSQTVTNSAANASSLLVIWIAPGSSGPVTIDLSAQTWAWAHQNIGQELSMALAEQNWAWLTQNVAFKQQVPLIKGSWSWLNQAISPALRHPLSAQSWSWGAQAISARMKLALSAKTWSWLTQDIQIVQSGTVQLASKLWAWTGQNIVPSKVVNLAAKAWNWGVQSLYIAGKFSLAGKTWAWNTANIGFQWLLQLAAQIWHWQTQAIGGGSIISTLGALLKWPLFWLWG